MGMNGNPYGTTKTDKFYLGVGFHPTTLYFQIYLASQTIQLAQQDCYDMASPSYSFFMWLMRMWYVEHKVTKEDIIDFTHATTQDNFKRLERLAYYGLTEFDNESE